MAKPFPWPRHGNSGGRPRPWHSVGSEAPLFGPAKYPHAAFNHRLIFVGPLGLFHCSYLRGYKKRQGEKKYVNRDKKVFFRKDQTVEAKMGSDSIKRGQCEVQLEGKASHSVMQDRY